MTRGLRAALALLLALGAVVWAAHGAAVLLFPYQYDYGEGGTMIASLRLAQGESVYPDIQEPPYVVNPYTPLYLAAGAAFMGGGPTFLGGRLVSLVAAGVTAALLFGWLRRAVGLDGALAGTAAFLIHPLVLGWSPLYRTDMLTLCLSFAGLLALDEGRDLRGAALLVLAFFSKQSMIAGLLAGFALLALQDRRRALRFGLAVAGLGLAPTAALQLATDGRFLTMCFGYNVMPFHPEQLRLFLTPYAVSVLGLLGLAAMGALRAEARARRLPWLLLAASLPIAVGSGREGGFYNYFLELHLALSAVAGVAVGTARSVPIAGALILAQLLAFGGGGSLPPYLYAPLDHLRHETGVVLAGRVPAWARSGMEAGQLQPWLDRHPGPLLAENLGNPTVLGRTPWLVDPLILFTLSRSGRWDPEPLLQRVDRQEFALILLQALEGNVRFPPEAVARILARYEPVGKAGRDLILVPRDGSGGRQGEPHGGGRALDAQAAPERPGQVGGQAQLGLGGLGSGPGMADAEEDLSAGLPDMHGDAAILGGGAGGLQDQPLQHAAQHHGIRLHAADLDAPEEARVSRRMLRELLADQFRDVHVAQHAIILPGAGVSDQ